MRREDFNSDNAIIDAALAEHAEQLNALAAASPKHGNCQIYTVDYTGTGVCGEENPNRLTFPQKPLWVTIFTPEGRVFFNIFPNDISYGYSTSNRDFKVYITWKGNTVSWYANDVSVQMNYNKRTYHVIAFFALD